MFLTAVLSFEHQYWPRVHRAYTFLCRRARRDKARKSRVPNFGPCDLYHEFKLVWIEGRSSTICDRFAVRATLKSYNQTTVLNF